MNAPQHKTAIKDALNRFTTGDLVQNARNLLNTLGYQSERTLTLESSTAETFIAAYDSQGKLNRDRALTTKWTSIDLLFQLSGTDLTPTDTTDWLFDPSQTQVDNTIIQSYLFFALRLEGSTYNRTQLSQITREINKLFMMPRCCSFSTARRSRCQLSIAVCTHPTPPAMSSKSHPHQRHQLQGPPPCTH